MQKVGRTICVLHALRTCVHQKPQVVRRHPTSVLDAWWAASLLLQACYLPGCNWCLDNRATDCSDLVHLILLLKLLGFLVALAHLLDGLPVCPGMVGRSQALPTSISQINPAHRDVTADLCSSQTFFVSLCIPALG